MNKQNNNEYKYVCVGMAMNVFACANNKYVYLSPFVCVCVSVYRSESVGCFV